MEGNEDLMKVSERIKEKLAEMIDEKEFLSSVMEPVATQNTKKILHVVYVLATEVDKLQEEIRELKQNK